MAHIGIEEGAALELITIEQLPVVAERFSQMVEPTQARVNELLAMDCNEDTKNDVKKARSELRKFDDSLKKAVKAKKDELFEPWMRVEDEVKRISRICTDADILLKRKIDSIEVEQKRSKEAEIREYFAEKCGALGVSWLEFEKMGIKIRLSDSLTSLRKTADNYVERVAGDVTAIIALENVTDEERAEIMSEYKACLNFSGALVAVNQRRARIAEEVSGLKKNAEEANAVNERSHAIREVAESAKAQGCPLTPPIEQSCSTASVEQQGKVYAMSFRVSGTLEQLKGLKKYIVENNISILE